MSGALLIVVGIGADGWAGLGERARDAIRAASEIVGSERQLELLPPGDAIRRAWPSPIGPLVDELVDRANGTVCVLASGDPMLHGIGAALARRVGRARMEVHPHPSSFAIACARLGWPAAEVALVSAVGRPEQSVVRWLAPGRLIVVFATGADGAARVAAAVAGAGYGPSRVIALEQLGGPQEGCVEATAGSWGDRTVDPLHVVAIECAADPHALVLSASPGLPDDAYETDGQLTKRHVRAVTLAALAPLPGQLLWDVGAGTGSIAIEWMRAEPAARAIAFERDGDRAARITANALRLGVPGLDVRHGAAPDILDDVESPDAIFVGGGLTTDGLLARCLDALRHGGRLVANAVTLEGEQVLTAARAAHGGRLVRLEVSHAEPIGGFTGWRAQMPVVQWSLERERG